MEKIAPFLWFDHNAEEAVNFCISIFTNSRIVHVARYCEAGAQVSGRPVGTVMTVAFELEGQAFVALNGGPLFTFSPAISFVVNCGTQEEIDELWEELSEGGATERCGWLRDKYGVSWQIVPSVIGELMSDSAKSENVMQALLQMTKIDIAGLKRASGQ